MADEPPLHPAGPYRPEAALDPRHRVAWIAAIEGAPANLRTAVAGLSEPELDTKYRNWTVRQIVHHLADSHVNSYVRFKWALTEDVPTIKPYFEDRWAALDDSARGDVAIPLALVEAVHARWVQLLRTLTDAQFERTFFHPESRQTVSLNAALSQYAWHGRHHTAQIVWLRQNRLGR